MLSYTELAVTLAEADAYAALRAWADWATGDDAARTAALHRSQDYIAATYNHLWAEEWDNDAAPDEVKYAIIEGARREKASAGSLQPDVTVGKIKTRVKVDAIDISYAQGIGAAAMRPDIPIIGNLLAPHLTKSWGASVDLLRV